MRWMVLVMACGPCGRVPTAEPPSAFAPLAPGVEVGEFVGVPNSTIGDSRITVLRVDPGLVDVDVFAASELGGASRAAPSWLDEHALIAATNVGLFETDYRTATFFLRHEKHVNQSAIDDDANHFLLVRPRKKGLPPLQIVDRTCEALPADDYEVVVQGWRMTDCEGAPTFTESSRIWSHASLGVDGDGRLLLIHAASPWSTHDFAKILMGLPLDLVRVQYAEGGPPAVLAFRREGAVELRLGGYETGAFETTDAEAWPLPFVLGVRPRISAASRGRQGSRRP